MLKIYKIDVNTKLGIVLNSRDLRFNRIKKSKKPMGICGVCGTKSDYVFGAAINDDLANEWGLESNERTGFDVREASVCSSCGSAYRSNFHASIICKILSNKKKYLKDAIEDKAFQQLKIAEINACGSLHSIIKDLPNLSYSEYRPPDTNTRSEDLNCLSYDSGYFDAVLTSDVIEHVPDCELAISEIRRVLKTGGYHIFTIPAILGRKTRVRAIIKNNKIEDMLPRSYHGVNKQDRDDYTVFTEFGGDVVKMIDKIGYKTKIYGVNIFDFNNPNIVFVSKKIEKLGDKEN